MVCLLSFCFESASSMHLPFTFSFSFIPIFHRHHSKLLYCIQIYSLFIEAASLFPTWYHLKEVCLGWILREHVRFEQRKKKLTTVGFELASCRSPS